MCFRSLWSGNTEFNTLLFAVNSNLVTISLILQLLNEMVEERELVVDERNGSLRKPQVGRTYFNKKIVHSIQSSHILTARQRSCGKVMFSVVSVSSGGSPHVAPWPGPSPLTKQGPPNILKLVYYVARASVGNRVVDMQLKCHLSDNCCCYLACLCFVYVICTPIKRSLVLK